jgi:acyl-CoA thioester hydrolase
MDDKTTPLPLLAGFSVVIEIPVQWGDQDAFGHVNNTVYFRWFESGRIAYMSRIGLIDLYRATQIGPILASVTCDYRRQVTFPDTVSVGVSVTRIGRSSIGLKHAIVSRGTGAIVAEATSTIVVFDYRTNQAHAVPLAIRSAIEALEKQPFQ